MSKVTCLPINKFFIVKAIVGTFNKEKTLVGAEPSRGTAKLREVLLTPLSARPPEDHKGECQKLVVGAGGGCRSLLLLHHQLLLLLSLEHVQRHRHLKQQPV